MRTAIRLIMAKIKRDHMETLPTGEKSLPVVLVPGENLPHGATHSVMQIIPGVEPNDQPVIGWAKPENTEI